MKRVFLVYRDVQQMLGKYRGYIPPTLYEDALEFASRGLFDHYYGNTEEYRPGKPLPRVAYQLTTAANDALHPFKRRAIYGRGLGAGTTGRIRPLDPEGRLALPDDWVHPTSFAVPGAREAVQVLDDNEVAAALGSLIAPPTLDCPMLEVIDTGYRLYPLEADTLVVNYLALPRRARLVFDYPADPAAEPVYNDVASVEIEWPAARDNQLLTRMLAYPALGLRDNVVQQVAQGMSDRGA